MMMPIKVHSKPLPELDIVIRAAQDAAKQVLQLRKSGQDLQVEHKDHNDLVTKADLLAEKIVKEQLGNAFPDDVFLAEESAVIGQVLTDARTWIIDPIDGTTNFAHGFAPYCISIALFEEKQANIGLVLEISRNELYLAVKGAGALLNGRPIKVSPLLNPHQALVATGFPYKDFSKVDNYLAMLKRLMKETHGIRRAGSAAYDLCAVASGKVDAFFEYGLSPWDVAAGALIVQEAGGIVTDWQNEADWLFGRTILAGNNATHPYLLALINELF